MYLEYQKKESDLTMMHIFELATLVGVSVVGFLHHMTHALN